MCGDLISLVSFRIVTMSELDTTDNIKVVPARLCDHWDVSIEDDEPGVFHLRSADGVRSMGITEIAWHQPKQPLTMVLETIFTEDKNAFQIVFWEKCLNVLANAYHIVDGKETSLNINEESVRLPSDSNAQVVVKLVPKEKVPLLTFQFVCDLP